jgi:hypothetical protein
MKNILDFLILKKQNMNNVFQILGIAVFVLALLVPQNSYGQLKIGASHAGGIVVFVFERDGIEHGLVCSKVDLETTSWVDAIKECNAYEGEGGYTDWYLPSKFELDLMYTNLYRNALGDFTSNYYWSSTEVSNSFAWFQNFGNGSQNNFNKDNFSHVRAVRAF